MQKYNGTITDLKDSVLAYYESNDFKNNYTQVLFEVFNEGFDYYDIKGRMLESYKDFCSNDCVDLSNEQIEQIKEAINENFDDFVSDYSSFYVGYNCIESISFGEQEENLNDYTNEFYGLAIEDIKEEFAKDFYINDDNYAYYDLSSSGLMLKIDWEHEAIQGIIE